MNPTKRIRVGVIGLGSQGCTYLRDKSLYESELELYAIADVNIDKLNEIGDRFGVPAERRFASDAALFEAAPDLDIVYICTRDRMHASECLKALGLGYHVLLEKPAGVNADECLAIQQKAREVNRMVVICHVLRYAPGYRKVKELIDSGAIGRVMTIQACEQIAFTHQAHSFVRGNCGNTENSSALFLQKCCHDMDLYCWMTGKTPVRVSSFGELTVLKSENAPEGAPLRCTDGCPAAASCPYNAVAEYYTDGILAGKSGWPYEMLVPVDYTPENMLKALREGPYGRCVYHCDNDAVDHQVVNLELSDGVFVNFTMSSFTSRNGRTMRIFGTEGDIWADMDDVGTIELRRWDGSREIFRIQELACDLSGHGGGESKMLRELAEAIRRGEYLDGMTSIERSMDSHFICLAAEDSRLNGGSAIVLQDWIAEHCGR